MSPHITYEFVSQFYQVLYRCFKMTIPTIRKITPHGPLWNTKHLSMLKNIKNKEDFEYFV